MPHIPVARGTRLLLAGLAAGACARGAPVPAAPSPVAPAPNESLPASPELPAMPQVRGPLALHVAYPPPDAVLRFRDSSFLFGTAGSGDARVTVDGQAARVWPNGAWLAYVALPADSVMPIRIEARTATDSVGLDYPMRRVVPDAGRLTVGAAWVDTLSLIPVGRLWLSQGEYLALGARAAEGAQVRLRLPDGTVVP